MTTIQDRFRFLARTEGREKTPIVAAVPDTGSSPGAVVVLRLYDPIDSWGGYWGVSAKEFAAALDELGDDVKELELHINSPGGEVFEGLAILNSLRQHSAKVTVVVDGLAASAASFVAMAGDEIVMAPNSELMIHDAFGLCAGTAATMTKTARDLDHFSSNIADVYARRTGQDASIWRAAMLEETWYSATEAVAAGLADRVAGDEPVEAEQAKNRFDLSVFAHAGRRNAPAPRTPAASAPGTHTHSSQKGGSAVAFSDEQLTTMRQQLGVASDADEDTIFAALNEALAEQAEPQTSTTVPAGMALVDSATLDSLRDDATAGRAARDQQQAEQRLAAVNAAVADGRIAPARKEHWVNQLTADPGAATVLASLSPGLIPLNEIGHDGEDLALAEPTNHADALKAARESDTVKNWRL